MVPHENARDLGLDCALMAESAFDQSEAVGRNCKLGWLADLEAQAGVKDSQARDETSNRAAWVAHNMRIGHGVTLTALFVTASYCRPVDLPVPWDKADIARDVSADLREFERLNSDLAEVEVLAWRRTERECPDPFPFPTSAPIPAPPLTDRIDVVLLWGRLDAAPEQPAWALVQASRNPRDMDSRWRRSLFNIEWRDPPGAASSRIYIGRYVARVSAIHAATDLIRHLCPCQRPLSRA